MAMIFEVGNRGAADILVYVTRDRAAADLFVCKVGSEDPAEGDGLWRSVRTKEAATTSVHFVPSRAEADLAIHYVLGRDEVGWRRESAMKGQL